jgi:RNA polymerase sigma-70 factor (ECF subfamily)
MRERDEQLVWQTLNGDRRGFDRLVKKYQGAVYGLAYHWTKNFADAQDLTQEAFFQAYEKLDQLRDREKFAGWLRGIATNLCRMWQRDRPDRVESLDAPDNRRLLDELPHPADGPGEALEARERQKAVADILARLSDRVRLTATLFYIDDLSYQEISDFLGVPVTTVESRLHKAKQYLKKEAIQMVEDHLGSQKVEHKIELKEASGFLHVHEQGYGFLRPTTDAPLSPDDIYVSPRQMQRYHLKPGDFVQGKARPPKKEGGENYFAVLKFEQVNHKPVEA